MSMLDGFLTAVVCGPETILPSEWMPWVWDAEHGRDGPDFPDNKRARRIIALLMRHYNDIALTLFNEPEFYEPLFSINPNDGDPIPIIDEWCMGFMIAVRLREQAWQPMIAHAPEWTSTMFLYGTKAGWEQHEQDEPSLERHREYAAGLADAVRNIHRYWLDRRSGQMAEGIAPFVPRREPIRNPDKVGRNDPCPCGSGRKYKQCHGSAERLH